jgi:hypothetical protein
MRSAPRLPPPSMTAIGIPGAITQLPVTPQRLHAILKAAKS